MIHVHCGLAGGSAPSWLHFGIQAKATTITFPLARREADRALCCMEERLKFCSSQMIGRGLSRGHTQLQEGKEVQSYHIFKAVKLNCVKLLKSKLKVTKELDKEWQHLGQTHFKRKLKPRNAQNLVQGNQLPSD